MSDGITIATIKKKSREEIWLSLDMFNGHRQFNMRVFYEAEGGSMRPGKNGLAFKVEKLEEFVSGATDALMQAKSKGILK